jgi:hypothetical protein
MAIAPEPGKTKRPTCSNAMVSLGVTNACVDAKQALPARRVLNALIRQAVPSVLSCG